MQTTRGLDRLVFFTDAVTAIAITLLILPLVDSVVEAAHADQDAGQFIATNLDQIGAFALSFVVIARLWISHHSVFEHVASYTRSLRMLSLLWAFTIVLLPLPTEMVSQFHTSPVTIGSYIGTMAASSLVVTAIVLLIRRHPTLELKENPVTKRMLFSSILTAIGFVVALIIGMLVPSINFFALLVLLLTIPVMWIYTRRTAARSTRPAPERNTGP